MGQTQVIYHMLPATIWQALAPQADYVAETLATESFIHCTREPARLLEVANRFYRHLEGGFLILTIDPAALQAELRWEEADGHLFPHIYGPIERGAIVGVHAFPRAADGTFQQPDLSQEVAS